jgi:hypothetical protein
VFLLCRIKDTAPSRRNLKTPEERGLNIGGYEEKRKRLEKERQEEYNQLVKKVQLLGLYILVLLLSMVQRGISHCTVSLLHGNKDVEQAG